MQIWDAIVWGVGAMGSAACYHLAHRGAKVLGLEAFSIAHDRGSSTGETRIIRQAYFEHPDYVPLLQNAYPLWEELEMRWGARLFHKTGMLLYAPTNVKSVVSASRESAEKYQIPHLLLSEKEAATYYPYPVPQGNECLFEPGAGYLEVENCVRAHAELAKKRGAVIHEKERAQNWSGDGDKIKITTDKNTYFCKHLILCPGAWASDHLSGIGIPIEIHRNLLFWFPQAELYEEAPCFGYETSEGFFYGFPPLNHFGLKLALHKPGQKVSDPLSVNRDLMPGDLEEVLAFVKKYFPTLGHSPSQFKVCLYEMSSDQHFILDAHPQNPNVTLAAGFSGHGFKFSSIVGYILADLALEKKTAHPIDFLRIAERF